MVKRYTTIINVRDKDDQWGFPDIAERSDGELVRYEDYAALMAESAAMRKVLEEHHAWHMKQTQPIDESVSDISLADNYIMASALHDDTEKALSGQAGTDLLAEVKRLREVELLAKDYRGSVKVYREVNALHEMGSIPWAEVNKACSAIMGAREALFAALGKEAAGLANAPLWDGLRSRARWTLTDAGREALRQAGMLDDKETAE